MIKVTKILKLQATSCIGGSLSTLDVTDMMNIYLLLVNVFIDTLLVQVWKIIQ